jgi:DNA-directed RNA polymerase specialized sigma24 family protein
VDIRTFDPKRRRDLWVLVFKAAIKLTRSEARAADLTQQTFLRLLTTSPWSEGGIPIEAHLIGILSSVYSHEAASHVKRRELELRYAKDQEETAEPAPSPEGAILDHAERVTEKDRALDRVDKLRVKLAGRQPELAICDFMADGVTKPSQLAVLTGRSVYEVNEALRRIRRYMSRILAAERGEDEDEEVKS